MHSTEAVQKVWPCTCAAVGPRSGLAAIMRVLLHDMGCCMQVVRDLRLLYQSLHVTYTCTEQDRQQFVVDLAQASQAATTTHAAHAELQEQVAVCRFSIECHN